MFDPIAYAVQTGQCSSPAKSYYLFNAPSESLSLSLLARGFVSWYCGGDPQKRFLTRCDASCMLPFAAAFSPRLGKECGCGHISKDEIRSGFGCLIHATRCKSWPKDMESFRFFPTSAAAGIHARSQLSALLYRTLAVLFPQRLC